MKWSWKHAWLTLGAFLLVWFSIQALGFSPLPTLGGLVRGSLGTPAALRGTFEQMTPLLIAGLAVFVALKAGLFNIGAEGQMLMGGMASVLTALAVPGPMGAVLALLVGALAGAGWSLPVGLIKAYRGGHEVITSIMLNFIGAQLALYLLRGPIKAAGQQSTTTASIAESSQLPNLINMPPFRLNLGLVLGVVLLAAFAWWIKKTVAGYELEATGENASAAEHAGVDTKAMLLKAMSFSGALAGLAGAVLALAYQHRFYSDFSSGYGFDALGVALLSGGSAWALLPSAFIFAVIAQGTTSLALFGVPKGMTGILLGVLIIVFAAFRYQKEAKRD